MNFGKQEEKLISKQHEEQSKKLAGKATKIYTQAKDKAASH